ncbi:MAG: hypothetical protein ACR2H3_15020 [Acidimicrobiales bacterium]
MLSAHWMSLEVFNGDSSATSWADSWGDALIEAGMQEGLIDWEWHHTRWGLILELAFPEEAAWDRFRALPAVNAALDGVPDPVSGLIIYRGRGGTGSSRQPRKPRPLSGAGAASLPLPDFDVYEFQAREFDRLADFARQRRQLVSR